MTLAQALFRSRLFTAAYGRLRESPAAVLSTGITFGAEVERYVHALDRAPGRSFVEVASGQGSFGIGVLEKLRDARFEAIDLSETQIDRARNKARDRGVEDRYRLRQADACALPFQDAMFEGALCVGGLHQIPDPARAIAEVGRVLARGGVFTGACFVLGPLWTRPVGMNPIDMATLERLLRDGGLEEIHLERTHPIWCLFEARRAGRDRDAAR